MPYSLVYMCCMHSLVYKSCLYSLVYRSCLTILYTGVALQSCIQELHVHSCIQHEVNEMLIVLAFLLRPLSSHSPVFTWNILKDVGGIPCLYTITLKDQGNTLWRNILSASCVVMIYQIALPLTPPSWRSTLSQMIVKMMPDSRPASD